MGNLNCIHRMGHKTVTGELNHLCLKSEEKGNDENGRSYFSSFKIFDRQRSSKSCRDSKEDREGNNACPLCKSDKTVINGEQDDGDQDEDITSKRYQSLLQPPFKALSTPGDALIENEVILLKSSWTYLKPHINTILIESFMSLFAENADVKEKFYSFKNHAIEDLNKKRGGGLASTNGLQRHIPRVSRAITKVINHVENLDQVTGYLEMLGKIHQQIGVEVQELMMLGAFFVSCSKRHLPISMQNDRHYSDSWLHLFSVISTMMRKGYPSLEVEFDLSPEEKRCVQRTLPIVQRAASRIGPSSLLKMFETYPNSMVYFSDFRNLTIDELNLDNPFLCNHGLVFVKFIEDIAADLDDRSKFESKLAQLGQLHENLGIPKQYLEVMGPIFCQIIRPVLMAAAAMPTPINPTITSPTEVTSMISSTGVNPSNDNIRSTSSTTTASFWSRDSKSAWLRFFRIIAFQMKRGYIAKLPTKDSDNQVTGTTGVEASKGSSQTDISSGAFNSQGTNLQSSGSTDNSQYLLLHHPSTTSEGSHKTKKRLARQKMLAISGFTSGFAKSFDLSSNCPLTGQTHSGVTTGGSSNPFVISDSHAQRRAMYLKQYNQLPSRRESIGYVQPIEDSGGYASPPFSSLNQPVIEKGGSSPKYQNKSPVSFGGIQSDNLQSKSGCPDFTFPPIKEDSHCSPNLTPKLAEVRRGSSCEITGINPFYHNRGRRQSTDLYVRKKHSLDNQLTIDSISSQVHIGI